MVIGTDGHAKAFGQQTGHAGCPVQNREWIADRGLCMSMYLEAASGIVRRPCWTTVSHTDDDGRVSHEQRSKASGCVEQRGVDPLPGGRQS